MDLYKEDTIGDDYFGNNAWAGGDFGFRKQMFTSFCDAYGCYGDIGALLTVKWYTS